MSRAPMAVLGVFWLTGCSLFGVRTGYEQASYAVIDRIAETVEVRRYRPLLVAETVASAADEGEARNQAFRRLFNYIQGDNRTQAKIAMTAPVETARPSETIAMTVPVETAAAGDAGYAMRFFLPAEYTLETAPEPIDPAVRIRQVPERTLAVLRFSGSRSAERVADRQEQLRRLVAGSRWRAEREPISMFYDPPWTIPFLRRNEVALPVSGG